MSAASDFGTAVVDRLLIPALEPVLCPIDSPDDWAVDVITYLLHWVDAQGVAPESVIGRAAQHWLAERGDGDDLCRAASDDYMSRLVELPSV